MFYLKRHHCTQGHLDFLLCYTLEFMVLCFTFSSVIHIEFIILKRMRSVPRFFFFCMCMSSCSSSINEEIIFAPLYSLFFCQRSVGYIYVGLFLVSLFSSTELFVSSLTNTTLSDYCISRESLKVG